MVAVAEIAAHFGVSTQRVYQWIARPDFPQPIAHLSVGRIWRAADVREWARRRPGRPEEDEQR